MSLKISFALVCILAAVLQAKVESLENATNPVNKREAVVINCIKQPGDLNSLPEVAINIIEAGSQSEADKGFQQPQTFGTNSVQYIEPNEGFEQVHKPQDLTNQLQQALLQSQPQQTPQVIQMPLVQGTDTLYHSQPQQAPQVIQLPLLPGTGGPLYNQANQVSQQHQAPAAIQPIIIPLPSNFLTQAQQTTATNNQPNQLLQQLLATAPNQQRTPQTIQLVLPQNTQGPVQFQLRSSDLAGSQQPVDLPCICQCYI